MLRVSFQIYWFRIKDAIAHHLRLVITLALYIFGQFSYKLRKQTRSIIQYQSVRYNIIPLSPISKLQLCLQRRKIMVIDLDETLIHSVLDGMSRQSTRPGTPPDFVLKVDIDHHPVRFAVYKRPHVDYFLSVISQWYELVIFTASLEIYGSGVTEALDGGRRLFSRRFYRQHCLYETASTTAAGGAGGGGVVSQTGGYTKDLLRVSSDLASVFILDNSPSAYRSFPDNAIPITSWFSDPQDTALLCLLPVLDALRFVSDVRSVLSRNLHRDAGGLIGSSPPRRSPLLM